MRSHQSRGPFLALAVAVQFALAFTACDQATEPEPLPPQASETVTEEAKVWPPKPPVCPLLCPPGTRCDLEPVACVRAPCPPIPRCVSEEPPVGQCAMTRCPPRTRCEEGSTPPYVRCVPDHEVEGCGTNVCGAGEFCCNETCGICAPKGSACTQQVCPGQR